MFLAAFCLVRRISANGRAPEIEQTMNYAGACSVYSSLTIDDNLEYCSADACYAFSDLADLHHAYLKYV